MRVLLLGIVMVVAISAVTSARAQNYTSRYPVCMRIVDVFGGERNECIYDSLQDCQQRAAGLGGMCIVNPFYRGARR